MNRRDLPTAWTPRAQARAAARADGAKAARYGLSRDVNPHNPATAAELSKSWNQGWRENAE